MEQLVRRRVIKPRDGKAASLRRIAPRGATPVMKDGPVLNAKVAEVSTLADGIDMRQRKAITMLLRRARRGVSRWPGPGTGRPRARLVRRGQEVTPWKGWREEGAITDPRVAAITLPDAGRAATLGVAADLTTTRAMGPLSREVIKGARAMGVEAPTMGPEVEARTATASQASADPTAAAPMEAPRRAVGRRARVKGVETGPAIPDDEAVGPPVDRPPTNLATATPVGPPRRAVAEIKVAIGPVVTPEAPLPDALGPATPRAALLTRGREVGAPSGALTHAPRAGRVAGPSSSSTMDARSVAIPVEATNPTGPAGLGAPPRERDSRLSAIKANTVCPAPTKRHFALGAGHGDPDSRGDTNSSPKSGRAFIAPTRGPTSKGRTTVGPLSTTSVGALGP